MNIFETTAERMQRNVDETDRRNRCKMGFQCPECHGADNKPRVDYTFDTITSRGWVCNNCGCQWDRNVYP